MMKQYHSIKKKHRDAVLFFRLGDFYEMFHQDAAEVSALLGLTLTKRNGVPMCGIPYHAAQGYIARLLKAGKKIAICEQLRLPEAGKGIAERDVIEIITPGTVVDEDLLDRSTNNYLAALGRLKEHGSLVWVDLSTGEFFAASFPWNGRTEFLRKELARITPKEIIVQDSIITDDSGVDRVLSEQDGIVINRYPDWSFDLSASSERLCRLFGVGNLKAFGITDGMPEIFACGVLIEYLEDASKRALSHLRTIRIVREDEYLGLDESTQRNLELTHNLQDGSKKYSLLGTLEFTVTANGARTLRTWLLHPLRDLSALRARLGRVETLYRDQHLSGALKAALSGFLDLERLSSRVALGKAHAKDLIAIRTSLQAAFAVDELLGDRLGTGGKIFPEHEERLRIGECEELLSRSIREEPSILLTEGNLIRDGYNAELDELRRLKRNGREVLEAYLEKERSESGISSLRIRYNRIIGYYLEVTKSNLGLVPDHFIRRQSLVGAERYTTDRLIELETELNSASEKIVELERSLFLEIRDAVNAVVPLLQALSGRIAALDCLQSFAYAATRYGFVKPALDDGKTIRIVRGRHPVVEANLPPGRFVPNSIVLGDTDPSFALITGPNMAGKSTFLRQTALIVLMAQIGSFVPADEAAIGLVDRIYCRVGAQDNLARGESTFLVEMNETAHILRTATDRSLVIMDEVGRGTGTNDGLAIAWAVTEHILETVRAKTLFATHYHELTALEHPGIRNLSMAVSDAGDEIVFLKQIVDGPSNNSYGIHVAKLAGLPDEVVDRAGEVLAMLVKTERELPEAGQPKPGGTLGAARPAAGRVAGSVRSAADLPSQGALFSPLELVGDELRSLSVERTTPLEALMLLARWQKELS